MKPRTSKHAEIDVQPPSYESIVGEGATGSSPTPNPEPKPTNPPTPTPVRQQRQRNTRRENRQSSPSHVQRFLKADGGARFIFISCCIFFILDVTSLVIGALYFNDCPINREVSIWLVVFGVCAGFLHATIGAEEYAFSIRRRVSAEERQKNKPGCVTVFGVANRKGEDRMVNDPSSQFHCNPILFYYAFSFLIFMFAYIGLIIAMAIIIEWGRWLCK